MPVSEESEDRATDNKLRRHNIPTYLDWLDYAVEFCEKLFLENEQTTAKAISDGGNATDITIWKKRAEEARAIGQELFEKYPDRVLLHGDLHHDNLLLGADGSYVFVDPKGVIGPEIFDLPRFILNEAEYEDAEYVSGSRSGDGITKHIQTVIRHLSKRLGYPEEDIRKLYYMEAVLAHIWNIEDGIEA